MIAPLILVAMEEHVSIHTMDIIVGKPNYCCFIKETDFCNMILTSHSENFFMHRQFLDALITGKVQIVISTSTNVKSLRELT